MRVLLDSHVALWALNDPERIGPAAREALAKPGLSILVSVATLWELAIKRSRGRLRVPADLPDRLSAVGVNFLPVTVEHAWAVRELVHFHGDPFDRLLVAQAKLEGIPLLTADRQLEAYDVKIIRA